MDTSTIVNQYDFKFEQKLIYLQEKEFEKMIESSESLRDLRKNIERWGNGEFKSLKDFLEFVGNDVKNPFYRETRMGKIKNLPSYRGESGLPTIPVIVNETLYELHGINHGHFLPLFGKRLKRSLKKELKQIAESFHHPKEGEDYFYEEGLSGVIRFPRDHELNDHYLGKPHPRIFRENLKKTLKNPKKILLLPLTAPLNITLFCLTFGLYSIASFIEMRNLKKNISRGFIDKEEMELLATKSLEWQNKLASYYFGGEMSQPLELEVNYLKELSLKKKEDLGNFVLNSLNIATPQERSLWTANKLREEAESRGLKKLHYICGAAHVSEIKFFLQNPDYSFSKLRERHGVKLEERITS